MPSPTFPPAFSLIASLGLAPLRPLHNLVRQTQERMRPRQLSVHQSATARARMTALRADDTGAPDRSTILRESGAGRVPTIVLGGLVPDATEQVFLLRRFLLKSGDVYYVQYPRDGFSLDVLCAQVGDLVDDLVAEGHAPIILAVSFGAGLVLEWLRRQRLRGTEPLLAGIVLVSPVSCVADLIGENPGKPATLLGRVLKPFFDPGAVALSTVEKSRAIFRRMFEAGAQNRIALRALMTPVEIERLREAVMDTIRGVTPHGAQCRVQALAEMRPPTGYFSPAALPLSSVPTLILFAEREEVVLDAAAPVRLALQRAAAAYFPEATVAEVRARRGRPPVQHASLIFHVFDFLPHLQGFYQRVRRGGLALAA